MEVKTNSFSGILSLTIIFWLDVQIKELENELREVEQKWEEYEEQLKEESQSQGKNMHLEESQVCIVCLMNIDGVN